jgi:hypothetical protein
MKPELHPDAARTFNDKTRALLDKVAPMTEALPSELPTHAARPGLTLAFPLCARAWERKHGRRRGARATR